MILDFSRRPRGFNSPSGKLDFDRTADALKARALAVCAHLLPRGHKEGHEWRSGDLHGAKGQSLGVHLDGPQAGVWKDFSSEEGGGDLVSLWAAVKGIKQGEAKQEADEWLGISSGLSSSASSWGPSSPMPSLSSPAEETAATSVSEWRSRAADHKWDYITADGEYFGTVYRWDHGGGKTIRPWDGRDYKSPEGARPLLYLPEILAASGPIVLVEGEQKCDRLRALGFAATSLWGGSQAVGRTDWAPLAGRDVLIWPDNDPAGASFAKAATAALQAAGAAGVRVCAIPAGKPAAWDADDATDEEAHAIIAKGLQARSAGRARLRMADFNACDIFKGEPPERRWLVSNVFPLGVACGMAAQGDTGKGMLLLDLALKVALPAPVGGANPDVPLAFGGRILEHGTAIILSAEDDEPEIHRRLLAISKINGTGYHAAGARLKVIGLPSHGGAPCLFRLNAGSIEATEEWDHLMAEFCAIPDLRLINFDPLASFSAVDVNSDPGAGAFVCGKFAEMASATGATVIVAQHMSKGNVARPIASAEEARHAIRGTSALVDNMRATYALWPTAAPEAKRQCGKLGRVWSPGMVVSGAVVKANGPADRSVRTYFRDPGAGLLIDVTAKLAAIESPLSELLDLMEDEIRRAALEGAPFTKTGDAGVGKRVHEMDSSPELQRLGEDARERLAAELLAKKRVVTCRPIGRPNALDVPHGPYAKGRTKGGDYVRAIKRTARDGTTMDDE